MMKPGRSGRWLTVGIVGLLLALLWLPLCATEPKEADDMDRKRAQMVLRDIARRGVRNERVLEAMGKVPRERYVPDRNQRFAYADSPLPIGEGQTISQPYIVAAMTEALQPKPEDVVLEVGTGSGYQAAVLAELVKEVYTIEIVESLARRAEDVLTEEGYTNVFVRTGDGYAGWPEKAPFDGIVVTAAPDHIPQPLIDQLKPGGRLVIPVGAERATQELVLVTKREDGTIRKENLMWVRFVPFTGDGVEKRNLKPE